MPPEDPQAGDNPDRPDWLPENFKSPEAFAQAYTEAQRKITEQGQQLAAQNETLTTFAQQMEELTAAQQFQPQADQSQINNQWAQMLEQDAVGTIALLTQQIAQQETERLRQEIAGLSTSQLDDRRNAIDLNSDLALRDKYEDFGALRSEVREEIDNNPLFTKEHFDSLPTAIAALDQAYRNVKASKGADDTQQQGFDARQMKLAAQGLQGAGGRPAPEDEAKAAWDRIRDAGKNSTYSELMGGR